MHRGRRGLVTVLSVIALQPAVASTAAAQTAVNKFNDWTLYTSDTAQKICFLASTPSVTEPPGLEREIALVYVSAWPKEGVKSELSVKLGFPPKKSNEPVITISGAAQGTFKLFVKDDRAYVADSTQELKLIEAMKKGSKLTIQAVSEQGATVTDTYALTGITAALQALAAGCP
jgi:invasion protein IalB